MAIGKNKKILPPQESTPDTSTVTSPKHETTSSPNFHFPEMTLATQAKDDEAFATAQRIAGVSRSSLGYHTEGRTLIERALIWFEQNRPQSVFRFGHDQHALGLAFLARIL
jgi:hypothetical protein